MTIWIIHTQFRCYNIYIKKLLGTFEKYSCARGGAICGQKFPEWRSLIFILHNQYQYLIIVLFYMVLPIPIAADELMTQGAMLLTAGMIRNGFRITGPLWGEPTVTNYSELTSLQLLNLQINQHWFG